MRRSATIATAMFIATLATFPLASVGGGCRRNSRTDARASLTALPERPRGLPPRIEPSDNPTTLAKVILGRALFFDERLSKGDFMACVDCHKPDHGWSASTRGSPNVAGKITRRKSPTVLNAGHHPLLTWDGRAKSVEDVSMIAWKNQLSADPADTAAKLATVDGYPQLFQSAFGAGPTPQNILQALGAFLRVLESGDAPYDRFVAGDAAALDATARRGLATFGRLGCATCHAGPLFTDEAFHDVGTASPKTGDGADLGREEATKNAADRGKFRTPGLRDVAMTSPYFHNGSATTLSEAIRIMIAGGEPSEHRDPALQPHPVLEDDVEDLRVFLTSLSGHTVALPTLRLPGKTTDIAY